jgi:hypothetical protein
MTILVEKSLGYDTEYDKIFHFVACKKSKYNVHVIVRILAYYQIITSLQPPTIRPTI